MSKVIRFSDCVVEKDVKLSLIRQSFIYLSWREGEKSSLAGRRRSLFFSIHEYWNFFEYISGADYVRNV